MPTDCLDEGWQTEASRTETTLFQCIYIINCEKPYWHIPTPYVSIIYKVMYIKLAQICLRVVYDLNLQFHIHFQ